MNTNFNYAGFIDMFLESRDDYEPYGITDSMQRAAGPIEPLEGFAEHVVMPDPVISPRR